MRKNFRAFFWVIYYKLPKFLQSIVGIVRYRPKIGKGVAFNGYAFFGTHVSVDDYTYVGDGAILWNVDIGKYCSIGRNLSIVIGEHELHKFTTYPLSIAHNSPFKNIEKFEDFSDYGFNKHVKIGNDVFIGEGVKILGGVTIGDGAVVGAYTLVNKDLPPYSVAVGSPCKVIKYRFSQEVIAKLLELQWWNWDIKKIEDEYDNLQKLVE